MMQRGIMESLGLLTFCLWIFLLWEKSSFSQGQGMFPFVIPGFDDSKTVTDVSWLNERPAGKNGFIVVKEGHFVDGKGKRIRFLGTNLTFGGCFPNKGDAEKIAARMSKYGFNCVRFHHMDSQYSPSGIWDPKYKDKQHLDAEQLDKLDYLIYQLKQHGIYVDLNLHVSRKFTEADGFPEADKLPTYDKAVDNFEPRMIELQKKYARDLLTHYNPYTKTRYVDEPAVAIVELNNENTLLGAAFGQTLQNLPDYYRNQLEKFWRDWLKKRYGSTEALRKVWDEASEPLGEDLLFNGDFAKGTQGWVLEAPKPAEAKMEVVPEGPTEGKRSLHAKLTQLGTQSWHFQVHQIGLDLEEGKPYTVQFWAKADKPRRIYVGARYDEAPWSFIGLDVEVELTAEWKYFQFTFRAREPRKNHNRLSFNFRNELGEVWLSEVKLQRGGIIGLPADQSLEAENIALPSSNASPGQWRDYIDFIAQLERKYALEMYRFLKEDLKLQALVIDTQASYGGLGGAFRESQLDFIDMHAYWQHPHFPGRPWDPRNWNIPNTSMVKSPGADTLTELAMYRVAGKPFTVSEYNHPAPNDYSAECLPMLAAFAAFQDWDGIFLFDYHSQNTDWDRDRIAGYFSVDTHPGKMAFMPSAAFMFLRGDIRPGRKEVQLIVPENQVLEQLVKHGTNIRATFQEAGIRRLVALINKLSIKFVKLAGEVRATSKSEGVGLKFISDTGEINWEAAEPESALFSVNSPKAKAVVGFLGGKSIKLGEVEIAMEKTERNWAAITLASVDGKPVETSSRLLLTACGNVENTDMGWNETRTSVGNQWGTGPTIVEGIPATISLATKAKKATVYALDGRGNRLLKVPAQLIGGQLSFKISPEFKTLWYELEL